MKNTKIMIIYKGEDLNMKILEIVFGNSCFYTMKKSKLSNNNILMINTLLNVGDLSNIKHFTIRVPDELCFDKKNNCIKEETNTIIENISKNNKIRLWTGHNDIYSYLIMLYVSSVIKMYNYELYVLYSDEYNQDCISPSMMNEQELEKLSKLEHKLSKEEIINNAYIWEKLVKDNSELRVITNGKIESVSLDYYNNYILDNLEKMGKVKISQLVGKLMQDIYLQDTLYVYLINRLIKVNKIRIFLDNNTRYFENLVEVISK